jgi:hypothetical protein
MGGRDASLDDELWEIAERADWRLMTVKALSLVAFVVAVVPIWNSIRIWKRRRTIEAQPPVAAPPLYVRPRPPGVGRPPRPRRAALGGGGPGRGGAAGVAGAEPGLITF